MIEGMRVLVTGGAGYIGSRVAAHLLGHGAEVTAYDSLTYGGAALLPFIGDPHFRLLDGDIRDQGNLEAAMRNMHAVVHFAERLGVERFLFFSTCSNYGAANAGVLLDENASLDPLSTYARTKVAAEVSALSRDRTTATTVLRLGTICGLSGRMRFDLLVNDMARAASLQQTIEIYKPQAWRPYLHVADVGRVVEHVLTFERSRIARRVFNVVAEDGTGRSRVQALSRFENYND